MLNCTKQVTVSLRNDRFAKLKKILKNDKKCFELLRETEKNVLFRCFAYFPLHSVPPIRLSYLLFEFRTFCLTFVHFSRFSYLLFECHTYLSQGCQSSPFIAFFLLFFIYFFWPQVEVSPSTLRFFFSITQ